MKFLPAKKIVVILAGILMLLICWSLWAAEEFPAYDEVRSTEYHDYVFTDRGDYVGEVSFRPGDGLYSDPVAVPVSVFFTVNLSRYHIDSTDLALIREEPGEIYFRGYQKDFSSARFWNGNDGRTGYVSLQTPGWRGNSGQGFGFLVPLTTNHTTISVDLDARFSERAFPWRHYRIHHLLRVPLRPMDDIRVEDASPVGRMTPVTSIVSVTSVPL
jgi:hypothetical protein